MISLGAGRRTWCFIKWLLSPKLHLIVFKEQLIEKGSESETVTYLSSPFLLENSGTLLGHCYLGKTPRNISTDRHPKPTLPATKVTRTGKQLKLGLPFPGLRLSAWLRKRQTDDSGSSPRRTTTQFSFEPKVTWFCCSWPNKDALFPVLCTRGWASASLVETTRAPKPEAFPGTNCMQRWRQGAEGWNGAADGAPSGRGREPRG